MSRTTFWPDASCLPPGNGHSHQVEGRAWFMYSTKKRELRNDALLTAYTCAKPPSTNSNSSVPVMLLLSSDARNATAFVWTAKAEDTLRPLGQIPHASTRI